MAFECGEVALSRFVNHEYFNAGSYREALKGIIAPQRRELTRSAILYRFANSDGLALKGSWWLEESQFLRVKHWAAVHSLTVPHAVRVLCAIAHDYGAMRVLVRARVDVPLEAYEGSGRTQRVNKGGRVGELLSPAELQSARNIRQLFIPGLRSPSGERPMTRLSTRYFNEGASHIGGVPGFPQSAVVQ